MPLRKLENQNKWGASEGLKSRNPVKFSAKSQNPVDIFTKSRSRYNFYVKEHKH